MILTHIACFVGGAVTTALILVGLIVVVNKLYLRSVPGTTARGMPQEDKATREVNNLLQEWFARRGKYPQDTIH